MTTLLTAIVVRGVNGQQFSGCNTDWGSNDPNNRHYGWLGIDERECAKVIKLLGDRRILSSEDLRNTGVGCCCGGMGDYNRGGRNCKTLNPLMNALGKITKDSPAFGSLNFECVDHDDFGLKACRGVDVLNKWLAAKRTAGDPCAEDADCWDSGACRGGHCCDKASFLQARGCTKCSPYDGGCDTTTTATQTRTATATTTTTTQSTTTHTSTTKTSTSSTTTTVVPCGPGEYMKPSTPYSPAKCYSCRYGTFQSVLFPHTLEECAQHSKCGGGEVVISKANTTHNNICRSHTECNRGEYESRRPYSDHTDRECTPITPCVAGQYVRIAATKTRDQRCSQCDGSPASFADGLCTTTTRTSTTRTTATETSTSKTDTSVTTRTSTSTSATATTETSTTETVSTVTNKYSETDTAEEQTPAESGDRKPGSTGSSDTGSTTIIVVVVVVCAIAIIIAIVYVKRSNDGDAADDTNVYSFENPMYASGISSNMHTHGNAGAAQAGAATGYMDVSVGHAGFGQSSYMDVAPNQAPNTTAHAESGYMDVSAGNDRSVGYMDVSPTQETINFDDAENSDGEEV